MAYTVPFTAVTGATILASGWNTSARDNIISLWVYTTAGDIVYASSSTALARLGIGAAGSVFTSTGTAPQWSAAGTITGEIHAKGIATITGGFSTSSSTLVNVTGLSITLNLSVTCTIYVWISGNWVSAGAGTGPYLCANINGTDDTYQVYTSLATNTHPFAYQWHKTGITSGVSRVINARMKSSAGTPSISVAQMTAIAVAE